jgi:two-component SAPR family response regulator
VLGRETPDILFSDVVMPGGMNGVQLAPEAKRVRPGIKLLLTSGYAAALEPAKDIPTLSKPYERAELARRLRLIVRG